MSTQAARMNDLATLFQALADPTRLRILTLLGDGEVCVCHIHESLRLPQPTVSRHLAYLRRAGLVDTRRDGLWVHYRAAEPADPGMRAALQAAVHAVGHVPSTRTDRDRLEKRAPDVASPRGLLPVISCCAPAGLAPSNHRTPAKSESRGRRLSQRALPEGSRPRS